MPIPSSDSTAAPRRLLRDVAFDKMLAAIVDGTLEPGERLNDDELVKWLGVSRTPIREAIAQLQTYGLVEIEANRYTKVAQRDDVVYAEAAQFLAGLHLLAREWGTANLDAATRKQITKALSAASKQLKAHEVAGPGALLDVQGALAAASGNALFAGTEEPLRVRVKFLSPRDPEAYDWDALVQVASELNNLIAN
ncbi:DNA-binding GntR family transcriptional regulator [Frigoribacterium sp. PvP120]|uniref:GntR family transcriptional regulator n=1 Tax=unclassified Frigoribacterium TaxID=2627005 RepID=UPI001AE894FC|nr:GntR family transcriptional regulator [Frigoribacterium sp. PvP121]MBP1241759.1 DNA-binding GntR family transcriptional regulator [Frigoribacterium sp. PvP121]